jgi:RING finger family protein
VPAFFALFLLTAVGGAMLYALVAANEQAERRATRPSQLGYRVPLATRLNRVANHIPQGRRLRTGHRQVVEGRIYGREITIETRGEEVVYFIAAPRLRERSLIFDAQTGAFEVDYEGDETGASFASRVVLDPKAKRALSSLTQEQGLSEIAIREGQVSARGPGDRLSPSRAKRILRDLHHLAHAAEGLALRVPVRPTSDKVIDWSTRRCPYCRDGLETGLRVACERCQTVHHHECFEELGRCTTAACDGTRGFPVTQTHERAKVVIGAAPCNECGMRGQGCRPEACTATPIQKVMHWQRVRNRTRRVGS